jgi:hypothetical protein
MNLIFYAGVGGFYSIKKKAICYAYTHGREILRVARGQYLSSQKTGELPDSAEFITPLFKRKKIISSQKQGEVGFLAVIGTRSLNMYSDVNKVLRISCCSPKSIRCAQLIKIGLLDHGTLRGDERHEKQFTFST